MNTAVIAIGSAQKAGSVAKTVWDEWQEVKVRIGDLYAELEELEKRETQLANGLVDALNERTGRLRLTPRQLTVLELLKTVPQPTNKEIGAKLFISERTVKFHVCALLKIFGVGTRKELFMLFLRPIERKTI